MTIEDSCNYWYIIHLSFMDQNTRSCELFAKTQCMLRTSCWWLTQVYWLISVRSPPIVWASRTSCLWIWSCMTRTSRPSTEASRPPSIFTSPSSAWTPSMKSPWWVRHMDLTLMDLEVVDSGVQEKRLMEVAAWCWASGTILSQSASTLHKS